MEKMANAWLDARGALAASRPKSSLGVSAYFSCAPSKKAKTGGAALAHHHLALPGSLTKLDELMHVLKALVCEEDICSSRWI